MRPLREEAAALPAGRMIRSDVGAVWFSHAD
jgi:hypothetical protein